MSKDQIEAMIEKMIQSGEIDPELIRLMSSMNDPEVAEKVLAKLKELASKNPEDASIPYWASMGLLNREQRGLF